jgi:hypothetical protein
MKHIILLLLLAVFTANYAQAQFKEAVQLATLTPTILVATADIENYKKLHYTISTVTYLGAYMITDSIWKSAAITLALGITKELFYDALLGRGEPLLEDMMWNTLGTVQGVVFTVSLRF